MNLILSPLSSSVGCCLALCCVVLYRGIVENRVGYLKRMKEGGATVPKGQFGRLAKIPSPESHTTGRRTSLVYFV